MLYFHKLKYLIKSLEQSLEICLSNGYRDESSFRSGQESVGVQTMGVDKNRESFKACKQKQKTTTNKQTINKTKQKQK
jgi:hypothetical protein